MVQTISETVALAPNETDSRDAAGGGGGGDAGGGGRDDARVAELTKLLCTVHDMSSQVGGEGGRGGGGVGVLISCITSYACNERLGGRNREVHMYC